MLLLPWFYAIIYCCASAVASGCLLIFAMLSCLLFYADAALFCGFDADIAFCRYAMSRPYAALMLLLRCHAAPAYCTLAAFRLRHADAVTPDDAMPCHTLLLLIVAVAALLTPYFR